MHYLSKLSVHWKHHQGHHLEMTLETSRTATSLSCAQCPWRGLQLASLFSFNCSKIHITQNLPSQPCPNAQFSATSALTMLCNRHYHPLPEPVCLLMEAPYLKHSLPFLIPPASGHHKPAFCPCRFACFRYFIKVESYNTCPFVTVFFHLAQCCQGASPLWEPESELHSFEHPLSILLGICPGAQLLGQM